MSENNQIPPGSYLRESRAKRSYTCLQCSTEIPKRNIYYRSEPHPFARWRGEVVRILCYQCAHGKESRLNNSQLTLPITPPLIHTTRVELVDFTQELLKNLRSSPESIFRISPEQFEILICDRFNAMGYNAKRVGQTNRKDGGVDVVFWPEKSTPISILGAVQVKHHRSPKTSTGASDIRDFAGTLSLSPFNAGLIVTNTTFTPDAQWFAKHRSRLLQLRELDDVRRWIQDDFTDDAEWRDFPRVIELCPGIRIEIPDRINPDISK